MAGRRHRLTPLRHRPEVASARNSACAC
jgi:hypothetical protein